MNWDAIGAIGEVLGALGVIATLLYLAVQIRQNTRAVRASTHQGVTDSITGFTETLCSNDELARIWQKGSQSYEDLDDGERFRYNLAMLTLFRRFENTFFQTRAGTLPPEAWEGFRRGLMSILADDGAREAWRLFPERFNPEFREWADSELQRIEGDAEQGHGSGDASILRAE